MEPLYDEGPKNWQNLFAITNISRFFFIYFTINNVGKENHSLYLKRLEVHFFRFFFITLIATMLEEHPRILFKHTERENNM